MRIIDVQLKLSATKSSLKQLMDDSRYLVGHSIDSSYSLERIRSLFSKNLENIQSSIKSLEELNQMYPLEGYSSASSIKGTLLNVITEIQKENGNVQIIADEMHSIKQWILGLNTLILEIESLIKSYNKLAKLVITKDLIKGKKNYLFHGVEVNRAKDILNRGSILGYTTQRYWKDGKRFKDNHPEYENSFWMKGISMSRDLEYSLSWAGVLLIFDKNLIKQKHEVSPYSWNYQLDNPSAAKKEREDFVVLSKKNKSYKNKDNPAWIEEYNEIMNVDLEKLKEELDPDEFQSYLDLQKQYQEKLNNINISDISKPEGEFNFDKNDSLIGIVLQSYVIDIYGIDNEAIQTILKHPKFLGITEDK